jgi:hypothetical protein
MMRRLTLLLVLGMGCGGNDDDDAADADVADPQPGTVTVMADVNDADGKILVGFFYGSGGNPGTAESGMCSTISGNAASVTDTIKARDGATPCDLAAAAEVLDPGTYTLFLGVFVGGSMTPDECAEMTAEVDGDIEVDAPALSASNC